MVEQFKQGNKSAFAKACGISNQSLAEILGNRQSAPSFAALQKILIGFPEVRVEWLVMGKGAMLSEVPFIHDDDAARLNEEVREEKERMRKLLTILVDTVPSDAAAQIKALLSEE